MAAVHFIPCKSYTAHKLQGKPYFWNICPCANDISCMLGLKMNSNSVVRVFRVLRIMGECTSRHLLVENKPHKLCS